MNRELTLRFRIKLQTWLFIAGLVVSGVTAIPIRWEVEQLMKLADVEELGLATHSELDPVTSWLIRVHDNLPAPGNPNAFLFYGTDWLAFGHFVIALVFIGALRDPVRNRWLFDFGLIACGLVIPYAIIFGEVRGIPFWWRLIDCFFGALGFVPLWFCRKWTRELEAGPQFGTARL